MTEIEVRRATSDEHTAVRSICNAAMLDLRTGVLARGVTLVAVDDGPILGALVLDGSAIEAVAVRPGRRGQGIGSALVEAAARRRAELTAQFDARVRPFYESLGFDVDCEPAAPTEAGARANDECRCRGGLGLSDVTN